MGAPLHRIALVALLGAGCGRARVHTTCVGGSDGPVVAGAAMFELDDYGSADHCAGADVADTSIAPLSTHSFPVGVPISLSLSPGPHTLVLRAFAGTAVTMPLGSGCIESQLDAGGDFCFDVTLAPVGDADMSSGGGGGSGDMAMAGDMACASPVTHDNGLGQSFTDCVALGTYDATQAREAAAAWDGAGTVDATARSYSDVHGTIQYVCNVSTAKVLCACWSWGGTGLYAGLQKAKTSGTSQCSPGFSQQDATWN